MRKSERLYRAIGGIDENKISDAAEYAAPEKSSRIKTVIECVAVAAVVCVFVATSVVLTRISGPKNGAASGEETAEVTAADTETGSDTDTEEDKAEETRNPGALYFVDNPVEWPSVDSFYKLEPYKYFMPEKIPENFVNYLSSRWVAGEYLCTDGEYHTVKEKGFITLHSNAVNNGNDFVELQINIIQLENDEIEAFEKFHDPAKLSVDNVEISEFSASFEDGIEKTGIGYSFAYSAEGYLITYTLKIWPSSLDDQPSVQDLFYLITSAQYFKDHPITVNAG
ncbi:MAG: hypothetical protein J5879_03225 [Clostridia bacterium]|nr:hypothetical protein [Clostridia bacterium]